MGPVSRSDKGHVRTSGWTVRRRTDGALGDSKYSLRTDVSRRASCQEEELVSHDEPEPLWTLGFADDCVVCSEDVS